MHRRLQHADARRDESEATRSARPIAPGAVLLVPGVDAPRLVRAKQPFVRGPIGRRSGEARTDRIHEYLGEAACLRTVHAFVIDPLDNRIAGRVVLGLQGGRAGGEREKNQNSEEESHARL